MYSCGSSLLQSFHSQKGYGSGHPYSFSLVPQTYILKQLCLRWLFIIWAEMCMTGGFREQFGLEIYIGGVNRCTARKLWEKWAHWGVGIDGKKVHVVRPGFFRSLKFREMRWSQQGYGDGAERQVTTIPARSPGGQVESWAWSWRK